MATHYDRGILIEAVKANDLETVKSLLEHRGAAMEINFPVLLVADHETNLLNLALFCSSAAIARELIKVGADVTLQDGCGERKSVRRSFG